MLPQLDPELAAFYGSLALFGRVIGATPLEFNKKLNTFQISKPILYTYRFHCNTCMCILKCFYLLWQLCDKQSKSAIDGCLILYWLTLYALQGILQICVTARPAETVKCMTEFFKLAIKPPPYVLKEHVGRYGERRRRMNKLLHSFVIGYVCIAIPFSLGSIAFCAGWHRHPSYLFSLVPLPYCENGVLIILFLLYELLQYAVLCVTILLSAFFIVFYALIVTAWLEQLRWSIPKGNEYQLYFIFQTISVLNQMLADALDPIYLTGHKIVLIPLTVIASFAVLYQYQWIQSAPTIYTAIVAAMAGCMYFQSIWYQMCMSLHSAAVPLQRRYITFNWSKGRPYSWKKFCRGLRGRHAGPFNIFRQTKPHAFLHKIFVYTMKIHFYVRK